MVSGSPLDRNKRPTLLLRPSQPILPFQGDVHGQSLELVRRAQVYQAVLSDYSDDYGNPMTGGHSNDDLSEEEQVATA